MFHVFTDLDPTTPQAGSAAIVSSAFQSRSRFVLFIGNPISWRAYSRPTPLPRPWVLGCLGPYHVLRLYQQEQPPREGLPARKDGEEREEASINAGDKFGGDNGAGGGVRGSSAGGGGGQEHQRADSGGGGVTGDEADGGLRAIEDGDGGGVSSAVAESDHGKGWGSAGDRQREAEEGGAEGEGEETEVRACGVCVRHFCGILPAHA